MRNTNIIATGRSLPSKKLTNQDLEQMVVTSDDWITTRTGIKERRIADDATATSDLSVEAGRQALQKANLSPEDIDLIIVATVTPDMSFPSTACLVQKELGAVNASAFDLEAACTGFIYGLSVAHQFIASNTYNHILVIGAETLSKVVDWEDRNTCVLFGDGAGAAVIGPSDSQDRGFLSFDLGADGTKGDLLKQPAGGSRIPASENSINQKLHCIKMEGNEVFKFAVKVISDSAHRSLEKASLQVSDLDMFIPHQANLRIIDSARKRLKLDKDKTYTNLERYGNMSAASIPVALDEADEENKISPGDVVMLVGFGGGLTWGSAIMKW